MKVEVIYIYTPIHISVCIILHLSSLNYFNKIHVFGAKAGTIVGWGEREEEGKEEKRSWRGK